MPEELPAWFVKKAQAVTAKRAKTVIDHILKHGHITTEELRDLYGYDHPPRAARDVREQGIPLETFRIADTRGKSIAAYRFGDPTAIRAGVLAGRNVFPKAFKVALIERTGCRCSVCLSEYEARYLQVDHRLPYEVAGEGGGESAPEEYQLICGSCNRAKSWSCEHCANWTGRREVKVCQSCYWASPGRYKHVALVPIRRLDVAWTGPETREYDQLVRMARQARKPLSEFLKELLRQHLC